MQGGWVLQKALLKQHLNTANSSLPFFNNWQHCA